MAPSQIFLSSFFLLAVLSLLGLATSIENCPVQYCGSSSVQVKFPFHITSNLDINPSSSSSRPRCGYPRFQLSCFQNQTILLLPRSGPFTLLNIDYNFQTLYINDPLKCLPKRYLSNFTLLDSPFYPDLLTNVTFLNCSSNSSSTTEIGRIGYGYRAVPCLSGENYTVLAVDSRYYDSSTLQSSSCEMIRAVMVPVSRGYWTGLEDDIRLTWTVPFCAHCEDNGEACGFKNYSGLVTGCSDDSSSGMSRGTKYVIVFGVGMPGIFFIVGLGCYLCGKSGTHDSQRGRRRRNVELSTSITLPPQAIVVAGLDRPTLESYPKTLLGESGRLPKPNDNTCSICLSEYQPKETLRTIPECNHYFHANCIDKWLRMKASCPVCRNSPEGSSFVTPSSTSTSSRSSSSVLSP